MTPPFMFYATAMPIPVQTLLTDDQSVPRYLPKYFPFQEIPQTLVWEHETVESLK